jgi:prepilin-type N-terminal cleavage/methylation domain-containing protein/prepilin-type processing-associated H-X9-DG protein
MSRTGVQIHRGFTLIELLVVIAIIAILAAILFPVFAQVREKARATTCLSNQKQIGLAFMQYVQDNDETFPRWQYDLRPPDDSTQRQWTTSIFPYIKNGDNAINPSDGSPITFGSSGVFLCPDNPFPNLGTSYAVNLSMMQEGPDSLVPADKMLPSATLAQLQTPADTVLLAEVGVNDGEGVYYIFDPQESAWTTTVGTPPGSHPDDVDLVNGDCDGVPSSGNWTYEGCGMMPRYRHTRTSNFVFSDGHVKAIVRGQLNWYRNIYIQGLYEQTASYGPVI